MPLAIDAGEDQSVRLGDEVTLSARVLCKMIPDLSTRGHIVVKQYRVKRHLRRMI